MDHNIYGHDQVVISGQLNYSDPEVQAGILDTLESLENTTFIDPTYTESWLRDFLDYVDRNKDYVPIDISTEAKFIQSLNEVKSKQKSHYKVGSKQGFI